MNTQLPVFQGNLFSTNGTTQEATAELQLIIGDNDFTYPKPEKLLKHIIELASNES